MNEQTTSLLVSPTQLRLRRLGGLSTLHAMTWNPYV